MPRTTTTQHQPLGKAHQATVFLFHSITIAYASDSCTMMLAPMTVEGVYMASLEGRSIATNAISHHHHHHLLHHLSIELLHTDRALTCVNPGAFYLFGKTGPPKTGGEKKNWFSGCKPDLCCSYFFFWVFKHWGFMDKGATILGFKSSSTEVWEGVFVIISAC